MSAETIRETADETGRILQAEIDEGNAAVAASLDVGSIGAFEVAQNLAGGGFLALVVYFLGKGVYSAIKAHAQSKVVAQAA